VKIASTSAGYGSSFSIRDGSEAKHTTATDQRRVQIRTLGGQELTDDDNVILQMGV
jgi:hypothetical protein